MPVFKARSDPRLSHTHPLLSYPPPTDPRLRRFREGVRSRGATVRRNAGPRTAHRQLFHSNGKPDQICFIYLGGLINFSWEAYSNLISPPPDRREAGWKGGVRHAGGEIGGLITFIILNRRPNQT